MYYTQSLAASDCNLFLRVDTNKHLQKYCKALSPLIHFLKLVPSEEDIIDGGASVTTWVTICTLIVWDHELGDFDWGSRILWNIRGAADYFQGAERVFDGPGALAPTPHLQDKPKVVYVDREVRLRKDVLSENDKVV